jgi:hypothetical protein
VTEDSAPERRGRPSIEERVARREQVDRHGKDRYDSLLRHLRAGREVPLERPGRRETLDWHPIAGKLVIAALVIAGMYIAVSTVVNIIRENRVDQWTGPDTSVTSGQKLDTCPSLYHADNPVFPDWIRFQGAIFQQLDAVVPVGDTNIGTSYLDTGYTLDKMRIYTVENPGLGPKGSRIVVRLGNAPGSEVYRKVDECS